MLTNVLLLTVNIGFSEKKLMLMIVLLLTVNIDFLKKPMLTNVLLLTVNIGFYKTNYLIKKKMKHPNQKAIVHASWFLLEAN